METNQPTENIEENQIAEFHDEIKQIELEGHEVGIKRARNALFWTAGLLLFWEILGIVRAGDTMDFLSVVIIFIEVGAFIALGFWTKTKPYTAIITGIILFFGLWILAAVVHTSLNGGEGFVKALFGGIIVRIIILLNLFRALPSAKEVQNYKN